MGRVLLYFSVARLAQLVERKALNLVVVGSSPTVGVLPSEEIMAAGQTCVATLEVKEGSLAERSKAPASGAGPKGREFESHSCH